MVAYRLATLPAAGWAPAAALDFVEARGGASEEVSCCSMMLR